MIEPNKPFVSICCLTYNQAAFIRPFIEGLLMQQTTFQFEILLHDDASTDNTASIIQEYEKMYPQVIKPIYQKENQYSKKVNISVLYQFPRVEGKYIALCEGDDYWTDPLKLQKQVDFLEKNQDISLCFHNCEVVFEDLKGGSINNERGLKWITEDRIYQPIEILAQWTIPTASVLFRTNALDIKYYKVADNEDFIYGDIVLFLSLAKAGKLFGMTDQMSVYRRHNTGATNAKINENYYKTRIAHLKAIVNEFGKEFELTIHPMISYTNLLIFLHNLKNGKISYKNITTIIAEDKYFLMKILQKELFKVFR